MQLTIYGKSNPKIKTEMKKSIFILLLLAVTVSVTSQTYGEFTADRISLQLDAYEHSNGISSSGKHKSHTLVVDDYYDIHLVKSKINRLVNEYSDIEYVDAWKWDAEYEYFTAIISFGHLFLYLGYSENHQTCIVMYNKIEGEKEL